MSAPEKIYMTEGFSSRNSYKMVFKSDIEYVRLIEHLFLTVKYLPCHDSKVVYIT